MGDYTRQINYTGQDHIDKTYYEKKKGEVVTSTLWNTVLGALVTRSNAYDIALQQTAAFESNFLLFQQEYRKFTQDFEVFKSSRAQFESDTTSRFRGLESAIDGLRVGQSELETADDAIRAALTVHQTDIDTLKSDVNQRMTRSEVHDYVADELSKIELVEVVAELPEKGETNKLYLLPVPIEDNDGQDDIFFEYVWADNTWERLGTKQIKVNLDAYVKNTDYATNNKAGVVKIGTGLSIAGDGKLQVQYASKDFIKNKEAYREPITPIYLDYAVKVGITTNTETLTKKEKANACEWLGVNALAVQNIVSGGEKTLTVNDVAPFPHKCSCKLTSDRSKNIYKFDSSNILNLPDRPDINWEIKSNGTVEYEGECDSGFSVIFRLKNLTVGTTYTFSLATNSSNDFMNFIHYYDDSDNIIKENLDLVGSPKFTFEHREGISYYDVEYIILGDAYTNGESMYHLSGTLKPQLQLGEEATEWEEYGNIIKDFSEVKLNVNGKYYTPTADGTVTDIESISPTMEITTNNEHVNICDFTYCVDTKKYIDNNSGGGSALGDIETALDNIIAIQENLIGGGNV